MQTLVISFNRYVNIRRITLYSRRMTYGRYSFKWYEAYAAFMKSSYFIEILKALMFSSIKMALQNLAT